MLIVCKRCVRIVVMLIIYKVFKMNKNVVLNRLLILFRKSMCMLSVFVKIDKMKSVSV